MRWMTEWLQVLTIVASFLGVVGAQTAWMVNALERVSTRIDRLEDRIDARFAAIEARFDGLESRLDARFAAVETRLGRIEHDVIRDHGERISRLEAGSG